MIERLDESFQHIHRFSADASHELRTPLTILRGEPEAAVQQPQITPELRETLGSASEETERVSRIVESLMRLPVWTRERRE
jgi:signal transduction histidine kinase